MTAPNPVDEARQALLNHCSCDAMRGFYCTIHARVAAFEQAIRQEERSRRGQRGCRVMADQVEGIAEIARRVVQSSHRSQWDRDGFMVGVNSDAWMDLSEAVAALPPTEGVPVCETCDDSMDVEVPFSDSLDYGPRWMPCPDCASPTSSEGR